MSLESPIPPRPRGADQDGGPTATIQEAHPFQSLLHSIDYVHQDRQMYIPTDAFREYYEDKDLRMESNPRGYLYWALGEVGEAFNGTFTGQVQTVGEILSNRFNFLRWKKYGYNFYQYLLIDERESRISDFLSSADVQASRLAAHFVEEIILEHSDLLDEESLNYGLHLVSVEALAGEWELAEQIAETIPDLACRIDAYAQLGRVMQAAGRPEEDIEAVKAKIDMLMKDGVELEESMAENVQKFEARESLLLTLDEKRQNRNMLHRQEEEEEN